MALGRQRAALAAAFAFGVAGNVLLFAGPLYMLQVYDRVLPARSVETLVALSVLVALMFAAMTGFDLLRQRILARVALRLAAMIEGPALDAALRHPEPGGPGRMAETLRDLEALRMALASPLAVGLGDLPFVPVFLLAVWVLHPALGGLALAGVLVLVLLALVGRIRSRRPTAAEARAMAEVDGLSTAMAASAGPLRGMAAEPGLAVRWLAARARARGAALDAADATGGVAALARGLRHGLQTAIMGLAAALVLGGHLSAGGIIAAMVLAGRALAPVDAVLAQAGLASRAWLAWLRLGALLAAAPSSAERLRTPPHRGTGAGLDLSVRDLAVVAPGAAARVLSPVLRGVSVDVQPGQALAVIGPAGAGKSALLRALAGVCPIAAGQVRLGGEDLSRWPPPTLAMALGYLPERPTLPPGTLAEAIASRDPSPDPARIAAALDAAGAMSLVRALPSGLETPLGPGRAPLSAGQVQRLSLARALYHDPALVLLDAPDAGLDAEGVAALTGAIRLVTKRGGIVVVAAQRPQVIAACDLALALAGGKVVACGARDAVLRASVADHPGISGEFPAAHGGPVAQVGGVDSAALRLAAQRRGAA